MALHPPEGLSYALRLRPESNLDPTPRNIVNEVVDFCLGGLPEGPGFRTDELGEMTGVVNWLVADGVTTANFYTTETPFPMLFVSLPVNGSDPWATIPGFMQHVKAGELTVSLINDGEIRLVARTEIDTALTDRAQALRRLPQSERENLAKALRGSGNLVNAARKIEETSRGRISTFF